MQNSPNLLRKKTRLKALRMGSCGVWTPFHRSVIFG